MAERLRIISVELTEVGLPILEEFEKPYMLREVINAGLVLFGALNDAGRANAVSVARGLIPADALTV